MDMMVVLSSENDRNADKAIIERLANNLGLRTVDDLNNETIAIRKLVKERRGHNAEATQQTIDVLRKFRRFAGMDEENILEEPIVPKDRNKFVIITTPDEFLCPISREIMADPVIVSTGQVYRNIRPLMVLNSFRSYFFNKMALDCYIKNVLWYIGISPYLSLDCSFLVDV